MFPLGNISRSRVNLYRVLLSFFNDKIHRPVRIKVQSANLVRFIIKKKKKNLNEIKFMRAYFASAVVAQNFRDANGLPENEL